VKLATYARRCESYFANTDNRPFSILEACDAMGIDYETLRAWEIGEDAQFAALARRVKRASSPPLWPPTCTRAISGRSGGRPRAP
jgi:hypothetical protein